MLALIAVILSVPLFITFFETGLVPRVPTAILCTGLVLIAVLNGFSGLILDTVTRGRREMKRRSEEHTSELQSLMRISYAVFCLTKKNNSIKKKIDHIRNKCDE